MDQDDPNKKEVKFEHIRIIIEADDVEPPPPGFNSKYKTVNEWLAAICSAEHPDELVVAFNFGLFESSAGDVVFLVGSKEFENEHNSFSKIDFEPTDMYFNLPEEEYGALNPDEVKAKLTTAIKEFFKTDGFTNSFLGKAKIITADFGGKLWPAQ